MPYRRASTDNNFRRSGQTTAPRRAVRFALFTVRWPGRGRRGCGPMIEAAPFPVAARFRTPRRPAGALRRRRGGRRFRPPDRGGDGLRVVGVRERHRLPRAGRRARVAGRERAPTAATRCPRLDDLPSGRVGARPALHLDRLPPRPRRLAQRPAVPQPRVASRLQSARQPHPPGALAAHIPPRRARRVPGRGRQGARRRRRGSCRPPRSSSRGGRSPGAGTSPAVRATTATPLDIAKLLTDDEIRAVTGFVGKFEDGKLTDLPTTEFYDSRHFKAVGQAGELTTSACGSGAWAPQRPRCSTEVDEHAARRHDHRRGRRQLVPRQVGRDRRAGLPGSRARRRRVDDLRQRAVHRAQPADQARQAGRITAPGAAARGAGAASRRPARNAARSRRRSNEP